MKHLLQFSTLVATAIVLAGCAGTPSPKMVPTLDTQPIDAPPPPPPLDTQPVDAPPPPPPPPA